MMTLPFWISTDQADRLKAALEAEGFPNVVLEAFGRDDLKVRVGTGEEDGPEHFIIVSDAKALGGVVDRMKKWRKQRYGR